MKKSTMVALGYAFAGGAGAAACIALAVHFKKRRQTGGAVACGIMGGCAAVVAADAAVRSAGRKEAPRLEYSGGPLLTRTGGSADERGFFGHGSTDVSQFQLGQQVKDERYVNEMEKKERHYGGPGYLFKTMDEAAQDFAMKYNDDSIRDNVEIASYIRKKGIHYFYDIPHGGTVDSVTSNRSIHELDIVALIHTHAAFNIKIKELPGGAYTRTALTPSSWDVDSVKETGLPLYTVTPDGAMFLTVKEPGNSNGVIHYVFDADFPSDPNCYLRKNNLNAQTMKDNRYMPKDEYERRNER